MLAYAAHHRPVRRMSPSTLLLIIGGHALALAAVVAIRSEVAGPPVIVRTTIHDVLLEKEPPPLEKPLPKAEIKPAVSNMTVPPRTVILPLPGGPLTVALAEPSPLSAVVGNSVEASPPYIAPLPEPVVVPVVPQPALARTAPRLLTAPDRMRPPYPENKRRLEEEAVLRLRLAIGADGRVTSVEAVGAADPEFLAAARTHLVRAWRYAPARAGGEAVATSLVITLRFQLEE